jgi:hypothetical protein
MVNSALLLEAGMINNPVLSRYQTAGKGIRGICQARFLTGYPIGLIGAGIIKNAQPA